MSIWLCPLLPGLDSFGRSALHLLVRSEAMATVLLTDPETMTTELLDLLDDGDAEGPKVQGC